MLEKHTRLCFVCLYLRVMLFFSIYSQASVTSVLWKTLYMLLLVTTVLEDKTHEHDTNVSLAISKTVHQLPLLCKTLELDRINTIIITYYYYCHHRLHHHHQNY